MEIKNKNPKTDWKVGDEAYMFVYSDELVRGHITNIIGNTCTVTSLCYKFDKKMDELFRSNEEAYASAQDYGDTLKEKYKSEIHNLKDLLQFALSTPMAQCEEYTNEHAAKAFRERAFELLGIEL